MALALLLIYVVLVSVQTADCYVVHSVYHCLFNSTELEDIQYISSFIYNKVEFLRFDSNIGNYVGYTPFGLKQADNLNNNPVTLSRMRAEEVQCCQHISELLYRNILNKSVKPSVSLKSVTPRSGGQSGMLICSVYDFYPKRIKVTWLKDGQEVTSDVTSTEELPDGTWLYQIHSSLEYTPRSGEKISCRVEHASLKQPLMTDWDPSMPESERNKIAIGASGLILGLVLSLAGFIYYKRKSRDLLPIPTFNQDPDTWTEPIPSHQQTQAWF